MWDTVEATSTYLSHDMPCAGCGHSTHSYLPCSDTCTCAHGRPVTTSTPDAGSAAASTLPTSRSPRRMSIAQ